jgi:8-oxo-dGTP pyrophosphatase MutT (NUDIX family)
MPPPFIQSLRARLDPPTDPPMQSLPFGGRHTAAVLILLHPHHDRISFPLTVRLDTLTHHPGQISLPGGRREPGDVSAWQTALREANEEIALKIGRVQPVGRLHAFPTVVSDHMVIPYVGWSPVTPRLQRNPQEVAEVLDVPIETITDPSRVKEDVWVLRGREMVVTYYDIAGHTVWGVTGRILSDLASRVDPALRFGAYPPGSVRPAG